MPLCASPRVLVHAARYVPLPHPQSLFFITCFFSPASCHGPCTRRPPPPCLFRSFRLTTPKFSCSGLCAVFAARVLSHPAFFRYIALATLAALPPSCVLVCLCCVCCNRHAVVQLPVGVGSTPPRSRRHLAARPCRLPVPPRAFGYMNRTTHCHTTAAPPTQVQLSQWPSLEHAKRSRPPCLLPVTST